MTKKPGNTMQLQAKWEFYTPMEKDLMLETLFSELLTGTPATACGATRTTVNIGTLLCPTGTYRHAFFPWNLLSIALQVIINYQKVAPLALASWAYYVLIVHQYPQPVHNQTTKPD